LAGIFDAEKIYLCSRILIMIYPAISATIGGRDGMDGGRAFWMRFLFWGHFHFWKPSNIICIWLIFSIYGITMSVFTRLQ
jgi:hypothetical protein